MMVSYMDKTIDLNKTVHQLCKDDPDIIGIMKDLGFEDITSPGMLNTAGRFMTIPKGTAMKGIDLDTVKNTFREKGYIIKE
jgi:hypothetical protein